MLRSPLEKSSMYCNVCASDSSIYWPKGQPGNILKKNGFCSHFSTVEITKYCKSGTNCEKAEGSAWKNYP